MIQTLLHSSRLTPAEFAPKVLTPAELTPELTLRELIPELTPTEPTPFYSCPLFWQTIATLSLNAKPIAYKPKNSITLPESRLFLICQGILQLVTCQEDGQETVLGLAASSSLIGSPLTGVQPYWAISLTNSILQPLSWSEVTRYPILYNALAQNLLRRLQQSERWIVVVGQRRSEERLKQMLCLLAQEFGEDCGDRVRLRMMLTHAQLATIISSNRVTVTRLIQKYKEESWLTEIKRHYSLSKSFLKDYQDITSGREW